MFVSKLRPYIVNNTYENIISNINSSNVYKVSSVFKLPNKQSGNISTLKLIFDSPEAVGYVLQNGLKLYDLTISPEQINKGEHIHIPQCFKCFSFCHVTRECRSQVQLCSICSGHHHFKSCPNPARLKCVSCEGSHHSTFARCPMRRMYLENAQPPPSRPSNSSNNFPPLYILLLWQILHPILPLLQVLFALLLVTHLL